MKKQGTIVRWDAERASGYIRSPDTAAEVYFHLRDYEGPHPIAPGTVVEFEEIVIGGKGPRALSVKLPPPPPLHEAATPAQLAPEPVLAAAANSPRSAGARSVPNAARPRWRWACWVAGC